MKTAGATSRLDFRAFIAVALITFALLAQTGSWAKAQEVSLEHRGAEDVILGTTTSTRDSGLLDVLVPLFEERTEYHLKPIAVGSGAAIKLGEAGEANVLLVHSPADEEKFVAAGHGINRHLVFYNDFVIVGPADDPAGIKGTTSAAEALGRIAAAKSRFGSRGDDSGTHKKELRLWKTAGIEPGGDWYVESGSGMGDTLNIASERDAYTIADRGTYLSLKSRLSLDILVEGDASLLNVYHVIAVNPDNYTTINSPGAQAFISFLLHPEIQSIIGEFGKEEFGQPLFTPCGDNSCRIEPAATPVASPASS